MAEIDCKSMTGRKLRPPAQKSVVLRPPLRPSHLYFLPRYLKGALLPTSAPKVAFGRKSKRSNMDVIPWILGCWYILCLNMEKKKC